MSILHGNAVVGQSGGPTAAINATVAGAVKFALESDKIDKVYAGINGIKTAPKRELWKEAIFWITALPAHAEQTKLRLCNLFAR